MGGTSSKTVLVVSLDALGTLYRFREPVAVQYSKVARQCGFKGQYDTRQLNQSFKSAFKEQNRLFPNYGKRELPNPQVWWESLVQKTFEPFVTDKAPLPSQTGQMLYEHFTSGDAYELFPDVQPFMELISELKRSYSDPDGPLVLIGVISNSDPRVRNVLTSLGFRVGVSEPVEVDFIDEMKNNWEAAKQARITTPVNDMYNSGDHVNFMTTSYDAGDQKPEGKIFWEAEKLVRQLTVSRTLKAYEDPRSWEEAWSLIGKTMHAPTSSSRRTWIHIGDDYEKDFLGAKEHGHEALLLDREGKRKGEENVVTSLEEAGKVISILAHESFRPQS